MRFAGSLALCGLAEDLVAVFPPAAYPRALHGQRSVAVGIAAETSTRGGAGATRRACDHGRGSWRRSRRLGQLPSRPWPAPAPVAWLAPRRDES